MSRALDCALAMVLLVVIAPTRAHAQPVPLGDEFIVNSETPGYQAKPAIASDAAGRFVVVWSGAGALRGQRFDADGAPSGTELEVSPAGGIASSPRVAMGSDGAFIVTWLESTPEIVARAFDENGAPRADAFRVDSTIFDYDHGYEHAWGGDRKGPPDAAAASDGGFVVVWAAGYNEYLYFLHERRQIMERRIDRDGNLPDSDFGVTGAFYYYKLDPAIAANAQGQFVVAWSEITGYTYDYSGPYLDRSPNYGIRAQQLAPNGVAQSATIAVAEGRGGDVAIDGPANFIVAWNGSAQRYDDTGAALGGEFAVRSPAFAGSVNDVRVAAADGGSLAAVWSSGGYGQPGGDGSGPGVFARTFASDGAPLGREIAVNTYTTGAQSKPAVAFTDADTFVVTWQSYGPDGSGSGVVARRFARAPACGDASADGEITSIDALAALAAAVAAHDCPPCVCDSDASGAITATDALAILYTAVAIQTSLGCEPC